MQNISVKPNFNMNEIQNKNILMPNFNYNYNFNLGQLKPKDDPSEIDLYNNSLMIFNRLQNIYSNNTISAKEICNTYNYSLEDLKKKSEDLKLEDISKRAQFYFYLYNLINKKKCEKISNEEYKCIFKNTDMPFQPNNKKIQININNPLFNLNNLNSFYKQTQQNNNLLNGALMNNGLYSFNNKNNLFNNSMSTSAGSNINNNFLFSFDNNNKDKNQFLNNKRCLAQNNSNFGNTPQCNNNMNNNINQSSNKKKKKKNRNKNRNKNKNKNNNKQQNGGSQDNKDIINNSTNNNNNINNNTIQEKINNLKKKKESPMIQIEKDDLKIKKLKQINKPKNNNSTNNSSNNNSNSLVDIKGKQELQFFEKDLKDYLKRTMSDIRKNAFFKNILHESINFMKNLFNKDSNVQIDQKYPIYRNNIAEISLMIESGGRIKICKNQLKE